MTRDNVKEILGEGATDEQVSAILNAFHSDIDAKEKEISSLKIMMTLKNNLMTSIRLI